MELAVVEQRNDRVDIDRNLTAAPQQLIHQSGLAMVDMGDDGYIPQCFVSQNSLLTTG